MKISTIMEGVEYGDLQSLVLSRISVAEFEPKLGSEDDVVVIGFYITDEAPANDLAKFLERGSMDVLDTEVSPNPDEEGNYMVFVEVENTDDLMSKVFELAIETDRLANVDSWTIEFFHGSEYDITTNDMKEWVENN